MLLPLLIATAACAAAAAWLLRQREPTFHVEGRVVLITGAAQGIGKLLATMMAERGADLVLWDISGKSLQDAKAGMLARFPDRQIHTDVVDVCNAEAVEAAAARAHSFAGARGVSVLVNNAGIVQGRAITELADEKVQRTLDVNVIAHFRTIRQFLPGMLQRNDGAIVTVASVMGMVGASMLSDYCASKWAAMGMHECLRLEIRRSGKRGVHALLVCPFAISTGMFDGLFEGPNQSLLQRLFFPVLTPDYVTSAMLAALERREHWLVLPRIIKYIAVLFHLLPVGLYDYALELMGARHGMDMFRGHGQQPQQAQQ